VGFLAPLRRGRRGRPPGLRRPLPEQSKNDSHEHNDDGGTDRNDPVAHRAVPEADEKVTQQGKRPRMSVRPMRVRTQNPVADGPDRQRNQDEPDNESGSEDDQLAAQSGPVGERAAGTGQQIQQDELLR
jgi:hypothetical protein